MNYSVCDMNMTDDELKFNNIDLNSKVSLLAPRVLNRLTSSMINFHNESWEICDIIFDRTYEVYFANTKSVKHYNPNIEKDLLYNYFSNICNDMNKTGQDCNYDVYEHMSKLLGVSNFKDII